MNSWGTRLYVVTGNKNFAKACDEFWKVTDKGDNRWHVTVPIADATKLAEVSLQILGYDLYEVWNARVAIIDLDLCPTLRRYNVLAIPGRRLAVADAVTKTVRLHAGVVVIKGDMKVSRGKFDWEKGSLLAITKLRDAQMALLKKMIPATVDACELVRDDPTMQDVKALREIANFIEDSLWTT